MKHEESMGIVFKNSEGENLFFEIDDENSIKELKKIIEKTKASGESFVSSSKKCKCCGKLK
mgnify:CR=1 FL=1